MKTGCLKQQTHYGLNQIVSIHKCAYIHHLAFSIKAFLMDILRLCCISAFNNFKYIVLVIKSKIESKGGDKKGYYWIL